MGLYTKSAQAPISKDDGIRICIMRRPGQDILWDIWMPHLAPSHELLTEYHQNNVTWNEFCDQFNKEVIQEQTQYLDILIDIALKNTVTIICWEETPEQCHRRLVAEECKKRNPQLSVVIN